MQILTKNDMLQISNKQTNSWHLLSGQRWSRSRSAGFAFEAGAGAGVNALGSSWSRIWSQR